MTDYDAFLASKARVNQFTGITKEPEIHSRLFDFQADIVRWALRKGRAAIWADTGLGKTVMQLEWARHIPGRVLILAPLAVAHQTVEEGKTIGLEVVYAKTASDDRGARVVITNYERMDGFDPEEFSGVVLDESSILKSYDGKTRDRLISCFGTRPYRLACTATPAPNDHMELGNHAEFLGAMSRAEMLSTFFVHDGGDVQKWRLKGHAKEDFWRWVCSWAAALRHPRDLGYDQDGYDLPALRTHYHRVDVDVTRAMEGELFATEARTLIEQRRERRATIDDRVKVAADLANSSDDCWLMWCDMNDESKSLVKAIDGAVEVTGSDSAESKESAMMRFAAGEIRVLVTKPQICGFGMNWQHCHNMAFVGVTHSFERYYQAVRRCWRFGQTEEVDVHVIAASTEGAIVESIKRKHRDADAMITGMIEEMGDLSKQSVNATARTMDEYKTDHASGDGWDLHLGDCVDVVSKIPDGTLDYAIFSPPFSSLYTYSASDRDMGNCKDDNEFYEHFKFLVKGMYRAMKPGRLVSFHCMNLPTSKSKHGVIGIRDFRGELIRMFVESGFIFHSEVVIWKDPVIAMQRTKALGLLWKQIKKDSAMSRMGIPDYLVTMRKPGDNPDPVTHTAESFPVARWQRYASPVWMDINPSDTLQFRSAREHNDERHICPLQLQVIERSVELWSNPGDLVLSPFTGIGSEGWVALGMGRRFIGAELKSSYFRQAARNLEEACVSTKRQTTLFDNANKENES